MCTLAKFNTFSGSWKFWNSILFQYRVGTLCSDGSADQDFLRVESLVRINFPATLLHTTARQVKRLQHQGIGEDPAESRNFRPTTTEADALITKPRAG